MDRASGTRFRVWAPGRRRVRLVLEDVHGTVVREVPLTSEDRGYFSLTLPTARAGMLYRYCLDDEPDRLPDPASRFQPFGPEGPSQIVDPDSFAWTDTDWMGVDRDRQVLYELHVGTFTTEGTWQAASEHLPALADLGITTIEVMPIAEFAGRFGWGYDGVDLFAPSHLYGTPDDLRRFINQAHLLGLGVILDVVYNHFGPRGNYLGRFAPPFFQSRYTNEWGDALNFDGEDSSGVREFMIENAAYWIDEFHVDGLRLDATQQIYDASDEHVIAAITRAAHAASRGRTIFLVAENEPQDVRLVRPLERGGFGLDAMWNEDFHHAAMVALTARREAYYTDYTGAPQEFVSMARWGFLYQGQRYSWQRRSRGTPTYGVKAPQLVTFLQNHDQVANAIGGSGDRLHQVASPGKCRAMTAAWLLFPGTPMFFQGQEFGATTPFLYFADHEGDLGAAVRQGRSRFMVQFRGAAAERVFEDDGDPGAESTFRRSVLCQEERQRHPQIVALHRDVLTMRKGDRAFGCARDGWIDGAVLGAAAFALRFFSADPKTDGDFSDDRLLLVNFGADLDLHLLADPLLAPPAGTRWDLRWSSEDRAYGGMGIAPVDVARRWKVPGEAAVVLAPARQS